MASCAAKSSRRRWYEALATELSWVHSVVTAVTVCRRLQN